MRFLYYKGVRYVGPDRPAPDTFTRCGSCKRAWDDNKPTNLTPVPAGRCPFEYFRNHGSETKHVRSRTEELTEALTKIAHMRCDGDEFFGGDGANITNDHLQDQMVEALCIARETLGITQTGPTRKPTKVARST